MNYSKPKHSFPCEYVIKVICNPDDAFPDEILKATNNHTSLKTHTISPSKNGKYQSLSMTLYLTDEKELENLYGEIKLLPYVLMVI